MSNNPNDWVLFIGRFHPVLVHVPIGGVVLAGMLELLGRLPRFKDAAQANRLLLGLSAAAAATAAGCGWMLGGSGNYAAPLVDWHRWSGIGFAVACAVTWLLSLRERPRPYCFSLSGTVVLLVVTSHLGGSITHGSDFLTRFAPAPFGTRRTGERRPTSTNSAIPSLAERSVFAGLIEPILERRCSACHGPEKQKGGLRMDSYEALLRGGKDGPVLIPGKALDSPMIHRLLAPLDDDDHMPPPAKPQPTEGEIALLLWWINAGAPADGKIGDIKPGGEIPRPPQAP